MHAAFCPGGGLPLPSPSRPQHKLPSLCSAQDLPVRPLPLPAPPPPCALSWQVLDEIVQLLTEPRVAGKMVVILAGYDQQIEELMAANPGEGWVG